MKKEIKKETMNNGITELVFILDRSGSMHGLEKDTIGGFNSLIEKQKKEDGECYVSTVLFSSESEVIHDRKKLSEIKEMTEDDYVTGGCTALIDAIGGAIRHIENVHRYIRPEDVPEKTMFIITTDGLENASRKYTSKEVKKAVEKKKEEGWEFLFIGANIDSVETAKNFGISEDRAVNYHSDGRGTNVVFGALSKAVCKMRSAGKVEEDWCAEITEDFESR